MVVGAGRVGHQQTHLTPASINDNECHRAARENRGRWIRGREQELYLVT